MTLFDKITSFESLYLAYKSASRGKHDRAEVLRHDLHAEKILWRLHFNLRNGTYRHGRYHTFQVYDPKQRDVAAAPFTDRIVHHALIRHIEPYFERIFKFIGQLKVSDGQIDELMRVIKTEFNKRQEVSSEDMKRLDERIAAIRSEIEVTVSKIKTLTNETAIKYIESEIAKLEKQAKALEKQKQEMTGKKPVNIDRLLGRARYFLEHLDELLLKQSDPVRKAQLFGAIFNELPTYADLDSGTHGGTIFSGVNQLFKLAHANNAQMVTSRRIELRLPG